MGAGRAGFIERRSNLHAARFDRSADRSHTDSRRVAQRPRLPRRVDASAHTAKAMRAVGLLAGVMAVVAACSKTPKPSPSSAPSGDTSRVARQPTDLLVRTRVTTGGSFSPQRGDSALKAFVPEVAPFDSGGDCFTGKIPGSGVTMVSASFPSRKDRRTSITLTFDSAGHLARYSELRGVPTLPPMNNLTDAQRDSAVRAADDAIRTTSLSFDYAIDQAIVMNRGGGKAPNAVMGTIRSMERLDKLGPPIARIERARRLCGV